MATAPRLSPPNIDFSKIPPEYAGFWIVVRLGDNQEVIAEADSPAEAIRLSRLSNIDPFDSGYAVTQVPDVPTAARMAFPGKS